MMNNRRYVVVVGLLLTTANAGPRAFQQPGNVTIAADKGAPLVDAVKKGDAQAIRALLKDPKRVNEQAVDGSTALQWAVHRDDLATTELLLRAGADVKAVNRYGVSALSLAAVNGNSAIIERLL